MLLKWKLILTNWINCYFKESNKKDLTVDIESLLDIISHIRENFNSSLSNSSLLDANTIQEFIVEKYPDFKFENGSVEPDSEDEVYLAASLLLFFVCLYSKNVDLKNAMCSKLSPSDQETILKFSKHLMECPKITNIDVQAAIAEACGQDVAAVTQPSIPLMEAETPPVLRSYHSEVRRLQAALDAERFDRNYLQEELTRTNLKVEKLLKDKEQYKLEIVDLKAQITLCCGQDNKSQGNGEEANNTSKIVRQLEQMEQRLLATQEQLDDVQYERETYKSKLNQLKMEHEKLLALNQQESTRASSLSEELEVERRHNQSLRELVAELRQHNHLNRMDSNLLECDDPDASINSLQHNSSACSEICANIIEVQLGEERAKIVALRQQLQLLQDQLSEGTRKAEEETQSLKSIITEKESDIMDLKLRINEEIEEKNTLKAIFNDEVSKLNNELNELETRLKGNQENSRSIIENKMQEIQNLQEEKLSLLHSLSDETMKLENIIKDLQYEVDAEKSCKIRLREEYDNHIMKLNEKVLNRNNELVELQNKILEKGEKIEELQFELKQEKELKDELSNKHNNDIIHLNSIRQRIEQDLQKISEDASNLQQHLQQHISIIEQMNKENNHLKMTIMQLQDNCKILNDTKEKLLVEIKNRDVKAEQIYKETENLKNLLSEERQKLQCNLEERCATVNALENQLQNEIQCKVEVQNKLQKSEDENTGLSNEIAKLRTEIDKITLEKDENVILINKLNETLIEKNKVNEILKQELNELNSKLEQLTLEVTENNNIIKDIKNELETNKKEYLEKLNSKNIVIETIERKLEVEIAQKNELQELFISLENENYTLLENLNEKEKNILQIQSEYKDLCEINKKNKKSIQRLQETLLDKEMKYTQLEKEFHTKMSNLGNKLRETKNSPDDADAIINSKSNSSACNCTISHICANVLEVQLEEERAKIVVLRQQLQLLQEQLSEVTIKAEGETQALRIIITEKESNIMDLKHRINEEIEEKNTLKGIFNDEVSKLNNELNELEQRLKEGQENSRNIIANKMQEIQNLQEEKLSLLQSLSDETTKLENLIKDLQYEVDEEKSSKIRLREEYDSHIMKLKEKVLNRNNELVELQNNILEKGEKIEDLQFELKREKEVKDELSNKYNNEITQLNSVREQVEQDLQKKLEDAGNLQQNLQQHISVIEQINKENSNLKTTIMQLQDDCKILNDTKEKLLVELKNRDVKAEQIYRETEKLNNILSEEKQKLQYNLEARCATVNTLQNQLQDEIQCKLELENKLHNSEKENLKLSDEVTKLKTEIDKLTVEKDENERLINKLNETIIEQNKVNEILKQDLNEVNSKLEQRKQEVTENNNIIKDIKNELEKNKKEYQEKLDSKNVAIETIEKKLEVEIAQKNDLQQQYISLENEKDTLLEKLNVQNDKLLQVQSEYKQLSVLHEQDKIPVQRLQETLLDKDMKYTQLEKEFHNKMSTLETKLRETENSLEEITMKSNKVAEGKDLLIHTLNVKTEQLEDKIKDIQENIDIMEKEKQTVIQQLAKEKSYRSNVEKEYLRMRSLLDSVTANLNEELLKKNGEITSMKAEIQLLSDKVSEKVEDSTDTAHSSLESYKTISDLEKIVQDKNRTITTLQSDITYLKSLLAESENNLLDVRKDLEVSKEHCHQLSSQLKKIVHQKNDEIADLKKQVTKMSVNENRASQIIKVSAKYQAIILKRIAEIKSNTVLKELTNFGNTANCDNELRRSLNAGTITMEDLENFLDTTDRHLKRCSEKQLALQKERDRLMEVNKINESEILNMKKFLTELSVSIKTFNSLKELYTQKLSRVVSLQRTVRREILSLDGQITDGAMCKLQRDYASIMQDMTECAMNMERWVERCLGRAISTEKIKQAISNEERPSLATISFQNASLEVQLEELENYFCKLLEEVARAQKSDAKDVQAVTVMEVRAEYEDKLSRMKEKMKQLYREQIDILKEKQRAEILCLEQELQKARCKLQESSREYEQHIRALTTELWNVGEKFLMKKDEAEWLRRKQRSGSLMSLQHVHSSGLVPMQEEPSRPSDTHSLRSLPVAINTNSKNEGRALHMSDEEGEVFDNRCLKELANTPARAPPRASRDPNRLSELQWRNSLCPPHLKSSYPAETQFVPTVHEEDIKCVSGPSMSLGGRTQRKEVGITAYKKPGPPTPSKQAGRLSATDSELRESMRCVEMEPNASRKTGTPSRIRALFRSNKADTVEGTPRSRRLSNIFRKK